MTRTPPRWAGVLGAALGVAAWVVAAAAAQQALAQLGLTDVAARTFVLNEIMGPALDRSSDIAVAGTRAFMKLPSSARGAAATGVMAWTKSYVNSQAFRTAYAQHRRDVGADAGGSTLSVDEEVRSKIDGELAKLAEVRKEAASMPPDVAAKMLESLKVAEQNLQSPAIVNAFRQEIEAARGNQRGRDAALTLTRPADPQVLFARRLREFLDATADVNFAARTINLNGGPDGIVFLDRADRKRHWIWQLAVIAGPEATASARTAAQAWLREIDK